MSAQVYFFQDKIPTGEPIYQYRYNISLVLDGKEESRTRFLPTGRLKLTREMVRDAGVAIGKKLKKLGILTYELFINKSHSEEENLAKDTGKCLFSVSQLEEGIKEALTEET